MTVTAAAAALEVSPGTVYELCRLGKIEHCRVGVKRGVIRISDEQLAAYRESCTKRETATERERERRAILRQPIPGCRVMGGVTYPEYKREKVAK